ncbi:MAG TPA: hypothetical protein VMV59_00140 [Candidatus Dormibacteraeota bacterium]|nr:hypothetical protein [Candidatus Dormibacteraeota bacterium]
MPATDKFFRYLLAIALQRNTVLDEVVIINLNKDHCDEIASLFRALDQRKRVFRQVSPIWNYVANTLTFQNQLRQVYSSQYFAW